MNQAWECPRCGRMNAPFNPACFCSAEDGDLKNSAQTPQNSEHVMDAKNYLTNPHLEKIWKSQQKINQIVNDEIVKNYQGLGIPLPPKCFECNENHALGIPCVSMSTLATLHSRE